MSKYFQDYYRCPDSLPHFAVRYQSPGDKEFLPSEDHLALYGHYPSRQELREFLDRSNDWLADVQSEAGNILLPFNPDQLASYLTNEVYAGLMERDFTRLGSNPVVRKFYYWTRPNLPVSIRSILQRIKLRGELSNPFPRWPLDRSVDVLFEKMMISAIRANGGNPIPFIWFWPEGKHAAFVLTHDVEHLEGKQFCQSLMDIDDEFGFKASFQIVPEERYPVEPEFLQLFRDRAFEICVHDLNHDGNLYREHAEFLCRAQRINQYCRDFGTQGFRSGALYRNLRWYGDFQFSFDMSVPNVGHLDPQGGGCCTVMPYYIGDILELPVTLTQDYSLFHILHELSIDLWKQQIRTIVEGHGLISVIAHPDYVIDPRLQRLFRELLGHVREQCSARNLWSTVPSEVNAWWRRRSQMTLVCGTDGWRVTGPGSDSARVAYARISGNSISYSFLPPGASANQPTVVRAKGTIVGNEVPDMRQTSTLSPPPDLPRSREIETSLPAHRAPLRVAMVSYSFYETDNRVLRYASTLAKRGDHVDVFALRGEGKAPEEEIDGVHLHRLQGRIVNEKSRFSYAWRICQFLLRAALQVANYDLKKRYDILHIHSVPDFMVLSAILPRLRGTPVILDIHDILPEFYASKFESGGRSAAFKFLVGVERASCRFASHVIIANDIWRERLLSRSLASDKCTVIINSPDRSIFNQVNNGHHQSEKFLMLYPGSLNWHQGLDVAIRAFAKISTQVPEAEFHIYGEGPSKSELLDLIKSLGVENQIKMPLTRSLREIAQIMGRADLGVVPKRKDNFGNEAFSTKILEFMAVGVPVIVSDTKIDKFYFTDSTVKFFQSGDIDDLARCMLEMINNPAERQRQVRDASRFVDTIDWTAKQHQYLELVDRLSATPDL
jgi:glycosyltransferase involved in cell wall biosynthesis